MSDSRSVQQISIILLASLATAAALYAAFPTESLSTPKLARKMMSDKLAPTEESEEVPQGRLVERYDVRDECYNLETQFVEESTF